MYKKCIFVLMLSSTGAFAASFDCQKASTYVEHSICDISRISTLDEKLATIYKSKINQVDAPAKASIKLEQQEWLKNIRNKCKATDCIEEVYRSRIDALGGALEGDTKAANVATSDKNGAPQAEKLVEQPIASVAETPDLEARYIKSRDSAYSVMVENTLGSYGVTSEACGSTVGNLYGISDAVTARLKNRCITELEARLIKLKAKFDNGSLKPENCKQWAIDQGKSWQESRVDMEHRPLVKKSGVPIQFVGQVLDGDASQLQIFNSNSQTNVVLQLPDGVQIYNPDGVKVNGYVSGYGIKVDSVSVELLNGRETTIPVIQTGCIQAK